MKELTHGPAAKVTEAKHKEYFLFELTPELEMEAENIQISPQDRDAEGNLLVYAKGPKSHLDEKAYRVVRTKTFIKKFGAEWQKYLGLKREHFGDIMKEISENSTDKKQKILSELLHRCFSNINIGLLVGQNPNGHIGTTETEVSFKNGTYVSVNDLFVSDRDFYTTPEEYYETILHESLHYFTNYIIQILEHENAVSLPDELNEQEKKFYKNLKQQKELLKQAQPETTSWINTYEFLTYALTDRATHGEGGYIARAENLACDKEGAEASEYSNQHNNLLNAIYNNLKEFLLHNKRLAKRLHERFRDVEKYLDENGEPRIKLKPALLAA